MAPTAAPNKNCFFMPMPPMPSTQTRSVKSKASPNKLTLRDTVDYDIKKIASRERDGVGEA